jgi:hypothetical protein
MAIYLTFREEFIFSKTHVMNFFHFIVVFIYVTNVMIHCTMDIEINFFIDKTTSDVQIASSGACMPNGRHGALKVFNFIFVDF